jgi:hypothetical protein
MKIVINTVHGGFGLSHEGIMRYLELAGKQVWVSDDPAWVWSKRYSLVPPEERMEEKNSEKFYEMTMEERKVYNAEYSKQNFSYYDIERTDPFLVQVVEELGDAANGDHAYLKVVDIPDDVEWQLEEYDGEEWVAEKHRTWC